MFQLFLGCTERKRCEGFDTRGRWRMFNFFANWVNLCHVLHWRWSPTSHPTHPQHTTKLFNFTGRGFWVWCALEYQLIHQCRGFISLMFFHNSGKIAIVKLNSECVFLLHIKIERWYLEGVQFRPNWLVHSPPTTTIPEFLSLHKSRWSYVAKTVGGCSNWYFAQIQTTCSVCYVQGLL